MLWKILYIVYAIAMCGFLREIWITRNKINSSHSLVVWDDMIKLRVICLVSTIGFAILTIMALKTRHRSLTLLWCGTIIFSSLPLIIPGHPIEPGTFSMGPIAIVAGLLAHLALLIIHDRRIIPRTIDPGLKTADPG